MKNLWCYFILCIALSACHTSKKIINAMPADKKDSSAVNLSPAIFDDKFKQGIDFIAAGNEPFWSIEIDFDKTMRFKTVSGTEIITPSVPGVKAMDADVTRYSSTTEKEILTVQIAKQPCINDMSGKKSIYSVTVDTKNNSAVNYSVYKGCGQYLANYRIHDIWVLDSINDKKIIAKDFTNGLPIIELNLTENKIFGNTGCNTINGTIEVKGKNIYIGNLVSSLMVCNNKEFESTYLKMLSNKTISYSIIFTKLFLQVSPDTIYIYKKVD